MIAVPRPQRASMAVLLGLLAVFAGCASRDDAEQPQAPAEAPPQQVDELGQLRQQASRGDLDSQFQLGSAYFVGKPSKDLKQAEYWWKQAADKGHPMAAVSLAYLYTGRDDPAFANQQGMLKYLNQSAAGGNPMAQHILGNLYLRGAQGVPRDPSQAKRLLTSACEKQYAASCETLKTLP
ncbi:tetratricopeptide repeat protein [Pseudomonas sp.]|uniref:tetratricopeptide repeat protein n=1 Tax=Pseudomonas sp. TaxID=306 RepID=UPI003D140134